MLVGMKVSHWAPIVQVEMLAPVEVADCRASRIEERKNVGEYLLLLLRCGHYIPSTAEPVLLRTGVIVDGIVRSDFPPSELGRLPGCRSGL